MKAAVLNAFGSPLAIETVPEPLLGTGEGSLSTSRRAACWPTPTRCSAGSENTSWNCLWCPAPARSAASAPPAPMRPGFVPAIGSIAIRPCARATIALSPDIALQGLTGGSEGGLRLQRYFHDGAWAEQCGCRRKTRFRSATSTRRTQARWCALGTLLVPYGGFLAAQLQAGEIALVNGATGSFGSAAVAVALGMGAQLRGRDRAERAGAE